MLVSTVGKQAAQVVHRELCEAGAGDISLAQLPSRVGTLDCDRLQHMMWLEHLLSPESL